MEPIDRMPPLIVSSIAIVGMIWTAMVLAIRLYLRYKLNGPIGNDDHAAVLATSLGMAQSALVLVGVKAGLGGAEGRREDERVMKIGYAATLVYLAATYTSRVSSCLLYVRLTSTKSHLLAAFAGLGMSVLGCLVCIFTVAFQCKLPAPWEAPNGRDCIDMLRLWKAIELTAMALELFIFAISLLLVYSLRMRRRLKAMVVFAFSVRLLVLIPTLLRLTYISHASTSSHSAYTNVAVTILTTLTTHISIMSSTLPCLKQFLAMFESGMIGEYSGGGTSMYGSGSRSRSGKGTGTGTSIALTSLTSGARRRGSDEVHLRPDCGVGDSVAEVLADGGSERSDLSSNELGRSELSRKLRADGNGSSTGGPVIRKTREFEVRYERW